MLVQLPCGEQEIQSNFILFVRTIVVLLICHLFKDNCNFVFIEIFIQKQFK